MMLGQAISMVLPNVVGYKLVGNINPLATSTDVVLTITKVRMSRCDYDFIDHAHCSIYVKWV